MPLRASSALVLTLLCATVVSHDGASAQTTALPSGWSSTDIGGPTQAGSVSGTPGEIVVRGGGPDIWETADQFHFAFHQVSGDVDISVRVANLQGSHPWAKAGLMIRDSLTDSARNLFVLTSATQGLAVQWRAATGGASDYASGLRVGAPVWLRLVRTGNEFLTYQSADGNTWTELGRMTLDMPQTAYVGLAVTSHERDEIATATFTDLKVAGALAGPGPAPAPGLPAPWASGDMGGPALPGAASLSAGMATITAGGADIWHESDQFHFLYQPLAGDADIVARVATIQHTDWWAKAGIMIRESLSPQSAHAYMLVSAGSGRAFQRRPATGSFSVHTPGCQCSPPGWVRLVREGNLFSGYESADGASWQLVGTDVVPMGASVYVGLAVTSHNAQAATTATFTDIALGTPANHAPRVSLSEPHSGAQFDAPATLILGANAVDDDGSIARVDFYQGQQLLGSAATDPFLFTWTNVPAGTYSLRAIATDNRGSSATSATVTVSVKDPVPADRPTTLAFSPSANHDNGVTSYRVELRRAGTAVTSPPAASRDLGRPALLAGEIVLDVSSLVDPLSGGDYYAVVVSIGPGGATPSAPSPPFTR